MVPILPPSTIITYVPTIPSHIRQRGYDHARLIAKEFAKLRHLPCHETLHRVTTAKQLVASRSDQIKQAKSAFAANSTIQAATYLLIDDIFTTGLTMKYAAKILRNAGAEEILFL